MRLIHDPSMMMRQIQISQPGGPEVLTTATTPLPQPPPGHVLLRVQYAGVNRADVLQRQGQYNAPEGASHIPGLECAGKIVSLAPDVPPKWFVGQRVAALLDGGGYAEYACAPHTQLFPVPDAMNLDAAAALPEAMTTVWQNIFVCGGLPIQSDEAGVKRPPAQTVLVHGGSSGVGTIAIQMIVAAGHRAIVTAGSQEKCDACLKLGAQAAIQYRTQDFVSEIKRQTENAGIDIVMDMVGGDYLNKNLSVLKQGGKHISIACQSGRMAQVDVARIMQKQLTLTGNTLRARSPTEKAQLVAGVLQHFWPLAAQNKIRPLIARQYPLANASDAHTAMELGQHVGKILLCADLPS